MARPLKSRDQLKAALNRSRALAGKFKRERDIRQGLLENILEICLKVEVLPPGDIKIGGSSS